MTSVNYSFTEIFCLIFPISNNKGLLGDSIKVKDIKNTKCNENKGKSATLKNLSILIQSQFIK